MSASRRYTLPADLIRVAGAHGVVLARKLGCSVSDLEAKMKAFRPVIALIHYGDLGVLRQDTTFNAGHWVVIVGVDDQGVIIHDPDWKNERRLEGANLIVPRAIFERAWANCSLDGNTPNQCLMVMPHA